MAGLGSSQVEALRLARAGAPRDCLNRRCPRAVGSGEQSRLIPRALLLQGPPVHLHQLTKKANYICGKMRNLGCVYVGVCVCVRVCVRLLENVCVCVCVLAGYV